VTDVGFSINGERSSVSLVLCGCGIAAGNMMSAVLDPRMVGSRPLVVLCWIMPNAMLVCLLASRVTARTPLRVGLAVCALGIAMNLAVVSANLGMPVVVPASTAATEALTESWLHIPSDGAKLVYLGDHLQVPLPMGHRWTLSPGDLVLVFGAVLTAITAAPRVRATRVRIASHAPSGSPLPTEGSHVRDR
jgi:hypothetical protein